MAALRIARPKLPVLLVHLGPACGRLHWYETARADIDAALGRTAKKEPVVLRQP